MMVGELLEEHKGEDTVVIDVSEQTSWTDGFVITTVNSQGHLRGLVRHLKEFLEENEIFIYNRAKHIEQEGWTLVDCGDFVVHLMNRESRDFYDLEKLWYFGKILKGYEKAAT
ncbi:MAG: ribosome silencing factor [Spirochaetales bacterium]|nr:ribosome silencing factor [Spirochaetales bacterium]